MPNWCYSKVCVYSQNKENITDLSNKLDEWLDSPTLAPMAWGGRAEWLGNILLHCGFPMSEVCEGVYGRCRGEINFIDDIEVRKISGKIYYGLIITTETAWGPMLKMWNNVINKLYPDDETMELAYDADEDECGCELYWRDDENNWCHSDGDDYYVDISVKDGEEEIYYNEMLDFEGVVVAINEVLKRLNKPAVTKEELSDPMALDAQIDRVAGMVADLDNDSYFSIHEYEYVPIEECD